MTQRMASRRAEEAAMRRQQATMWLQDMVGTLSLCAQPTEEELKACLRNGLILCKVINKVQNGAIPKVVEDPVNSSQPNGAQSATQNIENVKNFLVAVEDMGLPSFEIYDLEQGTSMSSASCAKVVDCILALKSYHEWKQGGALGFGRLNSPNSPTHATGYATTSSKYVNRSKSLNTGLSPSRRKSCAISDHDSSNDTSLSSSPERSSTHFLTFEKDKQTFLEGISWSVQFGQSNGMHDEDYVHDLNSNANAPGSASTRLNEIGHKFCEVLQVKARRLPSAQLSTISMASEGYEGGAALAPDQNSSNQSLLTLISAILGDKPSEEVPLLVELMLRKVMEEFERHLLSQRKQVTKMKSALKDMMVREEKVASQNMVLEALGAGTQDEKKTKYLMDSGIEDELTSIESKENHPPFVVGSQSKCSHQEMEKKLMEEERTAKEEEVDRLSRDSDEKQMVVQVLKNELDCMKNMKRFDEEQHHYSLLHKRQKKDIVDMEHKERITKLEGQLQDAYDMMQEIENKSAKTMSSLQEKDSKVQQNLSQQARECKDLRWAQLDAKEEVLRMQMDWKEQIRSLEEHLQYMAKAASGYQKVLAENRILYNEVQDLKGNIRVYCRVRPSFTVEPGGQTIVDFIGENGELALVNPSKQGGKDSRRSFTFNKCFGPMSSQEEVFLDTQPLIRSVLDGFNVCIFAYGQTGSGKTFTMSGPNNMTPVDWGVNYRALHDLFEMSQSREHVYHYEIGVQMLEIYNEQLRDLLATDSSHKKLEIRNNSQLNGLNVPDATIMPVTSTKDVMELMKLGQKNRSVGATALNERSSRSHSVLTVHVQGKDVSTGALLRGSLHLVDLAGSERVDKSEATGDRLKEAQHINKSLSALGDVIGALAQKNGHVPYRNSKLTQLLQDSLGGQAKTLMFVHISPDVESFGETMSTLKFAERVALVELGAARSNKESGGMMILKDQVSQLTNVIAKKDVEIANLHSICDRAEKGDTTIGAGKLKPKPTNATRRLNTDPSAATPQKSRRGNNVDNGGKTVETRQNQNQGKIIVRKKIPSPLALSTNNEMEDLTEHVFSCECSPLTSPTEQRDLYEVADQDGCKDIWDKQKPQKNLWNRNGKDSDLKYLQESPPSSSSMEGEGAGKESHYKTDLIFSEDVTSLFQDLEEHHEQFKIANGWHRVEAKDVAAPGVEPNQLGIKNQLNPQKARLNQLSTLVNHCNKQTLSNGDFEIPDDSKVLENVTTGEENNKGAAGNKRSSIMLIDVDMDEHTETDEAFSERLANFHNDNANPLTPTSLSFDLDPSALSQPGPDKWPDLDKKLKPNSHVERKGVLQTRVSRTLVKSNSKTSPVRADRKSTGEGAQLVTSQEVVTDNTQRDAMSKPPQNTTGVKSSKRWI